MTKKQSLELKRILIAGAIYVLLLILSHAGETPRIFDRWYLALALYLVPYFIVGWRVVRKALLGIKNRQVFDESFLMTVATVGAFGAREYSEAVAVMLFYQIGEFFQDYAVNKSRRSIRDLMDIAPQEARRIAADGSVETIDPDDVAIGDLLLIRPGDRVPVDGLVERGESLLNTAALTGESAPRAVRPGDAIISGCINGDAALHMRATKCYDDSTVARILELVETASEKKSRTEQFITRFARWYTPLVVLAALALALIPPLFSGNWMTWIVRACTFLVISCPCALVISIPLAFFGGIGAASKVGVLVKGSNYLEQLARLDVLVTDKTGTLTTGGIAPEKGRARPECDAVKPGAKEALQALRTEGVREIVMLSGDRSEAANAVGAQLGIDRVLSELLPQDKVAILEELLAAPNRTGSVAYIGDGINDAPVLSRADVGIAMGSLGSDAAIEAADVVIMDDDLRKIPSALSIARKTNAIAMQNIVFALSVKGLILLLGALGFAGMWAAVFADVGVAVLCILNSMRLLRAS